MQAKNHKAGEQVDCAHGRYDPGSHAGDALDSPEDDKAHQYRHDQTVSPWIRLQRRKNGFDQIERLNDLKGIPSAKGPAYAKNAKQTGEQASQVF